MTETFIPFSLPHIGDEEIAEVTEVLRSGWITTGSKVALLEEKFREATMAPFAVALNSATAALHLSLEALDIKPEDEVIVPTYTFAATAEVVRYFGARPILVDVNPDNLTIDPDQTARALTERTRAIIPVHIAGVRSDMESIWELSQNNGIAVIEDSAHLFPYNLTLQEKRPSSDFVCFSFYATKTITTGEGGMLCTWSKEWADRCKVMSLHGINKEAWNRYSKEGSWKYDIVAPGYKYNLTDIAAAIGLVQLKKAQGMRERRAEIAARYSAAFASIEELQLPSGLENPSHSWHLYMLRLVTARLQISRDAFIQELFQRNIGCSVHFIPLHIHPYYQKQYGYKASDFPISLKEYQREISLPIYSSMSDQDIDRVISAVSEVVRSNVLLHR